MSRLLRPDQVAERLQISTRQVHYLISTRQLDAVRIGTRTVRIPEDAVERMIDAGATRYATR